MKSILGKYLDEKYRIINLRYDLGRFDDMPSQFENVNNRTMLYLPNYNVLYPWVIGYEHSLNIAALNDRFVARCARAI